MLRNRRHSSVAHRPLVAVVLALATAAVGLVAVSPSTSAVPLEPVVLSDAPGLSRHDRFTDNSGRIVYINGDDDIRIFDPSDFSDELLVGDQVPGGGALPALIGDEDERLLYEQPAGTINAISLDGGSPSEFYTLPVGASIDRLIPGFGTTENVLTVDLSDGRKVLHRFDSNVAAVPAPLATYVDESFTRIRRVLPGDEGVVLTRTVAGETTLSVVRSAGLVDLAAPVFSAGVNTFSIAPSQVWYLADLDDAGFELWLADLTGGAPTKLLTHPELAFPQFDFSGGDAVAMNTTVYSQSDAFEPWTITAPPAPEGFETQIFLRFSSLAGEEVVADISFRSTSDSSRIDGGSVTYPLAGTEPVRTIPPTAVEEYADDVYAVVRSFGFSAESAALALLVEEPGGTFGIRYRPTGGSASDETLIDTGAIVRYSTNEVRFDDNGFRLTFVRNDSALHFVSLLDGASIEVPLQYDTASFSRLFDIEAFGSPGDIVLIEDRCGSFGSDAPCTTGSRLMYVEIPSIWIDPTLQSVVPARVLETRDQPDAKTIDGEFEGDGRVRAGEVIELEMFGRTGVGVPDTASAVLLNVVAVGPSAVGFLTLFPCGSDQPLAANVNYSIGGAAANSVLAKIGDGGKVCIYSEAETDVVIDVNGYVPFGGDNTAVDPARIYDSRSIDGAETIDGQQQGVGRVGAGETARVNVTSRAGVPSDIADGQSSGSAYLNVVAIRPGANGFLTVFPCTDERPLSANVNYAAGGVAPNAVLARLSGDGDVCIYSSAETDLVVDINGYVPQFSATTGVTPRRFLETRSGDGLETFDGLFEGKGRLGAGETLELTIHDRRDEFDRPGAVFLNIVAVAPSSTGFITVFPCDAERPLAANVNYNAGAIGYNAVFAQLSADGKVCLYSSAATDLVVDVNGSVYDRFGI